VRAHRRSPTWRRGQVRASAGATADAVPANGGDDRCITPLTIGVVAEHVADERRVALVADAVQRLATRGLSVLVEPGPCAGAVILDAVYIAAGAQISTRAWQSDVVLKVAPPGSD
jgi:Alanine dehydrogenase/PNT, N-terminal domain